MEPNEKIQLDDITFDDVIGGDGVETTTIDEIVSPDRPSFVVILFNSAVCILYRKTAFSEEAYIFIPSDSRPLTL